MILAYDFGTGGIKAALFAEDGRCVRDAFSGYVTAYRQLEPRHRALTRRLGAWAKEIMPG